MNEHEYSARVVWTGDRGEGTRTYRGYGREHEVHVAGKPVLAGSSDPKFLGDASRWNPEDCLLSAISTCHMLWFLHLASEAGWVIRSYEDEARAVMTMNADGSGQFTSATLNPVVTIEAGEQSLSQGLHHKAHDMCFIARSVNFPVQCQGHVRQE